MDSMIQFKMMWWALLDLFDRVMNSRIVNAVYQPTAGMLIVPLVVSFSLAEKLDYLVNKKERDAAFLVNRERKTNHQ